MICATCIAGGKANKYGDTYWAIAMHNKCTGCPCQHKTGAGWYKIKA